MLIVFGLPSIDLLLQGFTIWNEEYLSKFMK
jgi:hypothetical protein